MPSPLTVSVIEVLHSSTLKGSTKHYHTFRGVCMATVRWELHALQPAPCTLFPFDIRLIANQTANSSGCGYLIQCFVESICSDVVQPEGNRVYDTRQQHSTISNTAVYGLLFPLQNHHSTFRERPYRYAGKICRLSLRLPAQVWQTDRAPCIEIYIYIYICRQVYMFCTVVNSTDLIIFVPQSLYILNFRFSYNNILCL